MSFGLSWVTSFSIIWHNAGWLVSVFPFFYLLLFAVEFIIRHGTLAIIGAVASSSQHPQYWFWVNICQSSFTKRSLFIGIYLYTYTIWYVEKKPEQSDIYHHLMTWTPRLLPFSYTYVNISPFVCKSKQYQTNGKWVNLCHTEKLRNFYFDLDYAKKKYHGQFAVNFVSFISVC